MTTGSSFVNIGDRGFWVRDCWTVCLRLIALRLDQSIRSGPAVGVIRDRFLLASAGGFNGCVPHGLEEAVATVAGEQALRRAIHALLAALEAGPERVSIATPDLPALPRDYTHEIAASDLVALGHACIELIEGKIAWTAADAPTLPLRIATRWPSKPGGRP